MHSKRPSHARLTRAAGGFSLTELLVVIGIIILLVGLLLVALGAVQRKAKRSGTESTIQNFANACAAFQAQHGRYPGVIPEDVLLHHQTLHDGLPISSTENALLHLMGGFRVRSPADKPGSAASRAYDDYVALDPATVVQLDFDAPGGGVWELAFYKQRIGEGPVVDGKPYGPYYTPGKNDLATVPGQYDGGSSGNTLLPDLIDAWGQPIVYIRQTRDRGPLVQDSAAGAPVPQFLLAGVDAYLHRSMNSGAEDAVGGPGELGEHQVFVLGNNRDGSILAIGSDDEKAQTMALILAHPAFYKTSEPLYGQSRGAFLLLSAGPDGIYFSATDGPGSDADPIDTNGSNTLNSLLQLGPKVTEEFDDVRVFGGG